MQKRELRFLFWMGLIVYFGLSTVWQILYNLAPTGFTATIAPTNSSIFEQLKVMIYPFILVSLGMYYFVLSNTQEVVLTNIHGKAVKHVPMENVTKHKSFLTAMMLGLLALGTAYIIIGSIFSAFGGSVNASGHFIVFAIASLLAFVAAYLLLTSKIQLTKLFYIVLPVFAVLLVLFICLNFFKIESTFFYLCTICSEYH